MNIKEFIEKVNERNGMRAKKTDEGIVIGTPNNMGILNIPKDATNFIEIGTRSTNSSLYWKKPDREYLSALIEEFIHTPIKERYPENKYHLRWINDDDGTPNYLGVNDGFWDLNYKVTTYNGTIFAEKELQQLKINNPRLAPAIDAMKEPVEKE